jgi:hypothetical protein
MDLIIEGVQQTLIEIAAFREAHGLPADFGVTCFESKDWDGLGRIDAGGQALNQLRDAVLEAVPSRLAFERLPDALRTLSGLFRTQLEAINERIGLKRTEIEFASSGFDDMLQAAFYAWARARLAKIPPPTFEAVYHAWLADSVRVSSTVHPYAHGGALWQVRVLNTIYGRAGLVVTLEKGHTVYVLDSALACPAEGFMVHLLKQTYKKLYNASVG